MRKHLLAASVAIVGFLVVSSTSLSAQMASRKGLYVSVGGGVGQSTTAVAFSEGDGSERFGELGAAWTANIGWGLNDHWAFGIEGDYQQTGCSECEGEVHFTNTFYSAAATYYPSTMNNFFVKLNLGYGTNKVDEEGTSANANGVSGGIGFGYDWMVGKGGFIVKPYAQYISMFSASSYGSGNEFEDSKGRGEILQFGIALGYKH